MFYTNTIDAFRRALSLTVAWCLIFNVSQAATISTGVSNRDSSNPMFSVEALSSTGIPYTEIPFGKPATKHVMGQLAKDSLKEKESEPLDAALQRAKDQVWGEIFKYLGVTTTQDAQPHMRDLQKLDSAQAIAEQGADEAGIHFAFILQKFQTGRWDLELVGIDPHGQWDWHAPREENGGHHPLWPGGKSDFEKLAARDGSLYHHQLEIILKASTHWRTRTLDDGDSFQTAVRSALAYFTGYLEQQLINPENLNSLIARIEESSLDHNFPWIQSIADAAYLLRAETQKASGTVSPSMKGMGIDNEVSIDPAIVKRWKAAVSHSFPSMKSIQIQGFTFHNVKFLHGPDVADDLAHYGIAGSYFFDGDTIVIVTAADPTVEAGAATFGVVREDIQAAYHDYVEATIERHIRANVWFRFISLFRFIPGVASLQDYKLHHDAHIVAAASQLLAFGTAWHFKQASLMTVQARKDLVEEATQGAKRAYQHRIVRKYLGHKKLIEVAELEATIVNEARQLNEDHARLQRRDRSRLSTRRTWLGGLVGAFLADRLRLAILTSA